MVVQHKFQTFWPRFWAGLIDSAVFIPLVGLDWLIQKSISVPAILALWFLFYTLSFDIYSVVLHAKYGQTVGKMATGIRVLSLSEGQLTLRQAVLRDIVPILFSLMSLVFWLPRIIQGENSYGETSALTWVDEVAIFGSLIWFAVELATMLTNQKRRAIHDFIAGSVVVRVERAARVVPPDAADA